MPPAPPSDVQLGGRLGAELLDTFGHVSAGHFNPALTVGLAVARRFGWREVPHHIATRVVAATAANNPAIDLVHRASDAVRKKG